MFLVVVDLEAFKGGLLLWIFIQCPSVTERKLFGSIWPAIILSLYYYFISICFYTPGVNFINPICPFTKIWNCFFSNLLKVNSKWWTGQIWAKYALWNPKDPETQLEEKMIFFPKPCCNFCDDFMSSCCIEQQKCIQVWFSIWTCSPERLPSKLTSTLCHIAWWSNDMCL